MSSSLLNKCRVCLSEDAPMNSFFDEVEYDVCIKLNEVFKKVAGIEVLETETTKPICLCHECTERLLGSYEFMCAVEKSEQEIELFLEQEEQQAILCSEAEKSILFNYDEQTVAETDTDTNMVYRSDAMDDEEVEDIEILEDEYLEHDRAESIVNQDDNHVDSVAEKNIDSNIILVIPEQTEPESSPDKTTNMGSRLSKRLTSSCYKCTTCQRSFAKIETLERHIKMTHTTNVLQGDESTKTDKNSASDNKTIVCSYCQQIFKRRLNYIRHLFVVHSTEAKNLTAEEKELLKNKQNYKKVPCPHCGEVFTQGSLTVHIRRHTGENPYQCDECDKAFPRRQDLTIHQRRHTGERPHSCTVCGKAFARPNKLARHMRIHTGERPYKCTHCERSFAQSNDLKIHIRRHTGERPYSCTECPEAFICGAALRTHCRQVNHKLPQGNIIDPSSSWRVSSRNANVELLMEDDYNSTNNSAKNTETSEQLYNSQIKLENIKMDLIEVEQE